MEGWICVRTGDLTIAVETVSVSNRVAGSAFADLASGEGGAGARRNSRMPSLGYENEGKNHHLNEAYWTLIISGEGIPGRLD
jgi:hypothetical protein